MRRTTLDPQFAEAAWDARSASVVEDEINLRCALITPMYGGGTNAGEIDRELPIRATALRGQLRFWWRLLNDRGQGSNALFDAETALWGGISGAGPQASRVAARVDAPSVEDGDLARKNELRQLPPYALIVEPGKNPMLLKHGYRFDVVLRFKHSITPDQRGQVVEALRWWANFGGVGARIRRGIGAVRVDGYEGLRPVRRAEVESRGGRFALGNPRRDALDAWKDAVDRLRQFRQGPGVGRNPGQRPDRPGRSRWPEADTIRKASGRHAPKHAPEHPAAGFYPRGAFGLPIVFHFKDRDDPRDSTLNPADSDRMASPLILRPWFDGERYRPLALLLPGWRERPSVRVTVDGATARPAWPRDESERERMAQQIGPMRNRGADALSAFMGYFEEQG